jgi:hypothetical protein
LIFYHASSYLGEYAKVIYEDPAERKKWTAETCSDLKNKPGGASQILKEMKQNGQTHLSADKLDPVSRAITYFGNHLDKMDYDQYQKQKLPIGSGVVEAACKTLVKQRLSKSGSRWTRTTVDHILMARGLILTQDRWRQFWKKVDRYGFLAYIRTEPHPLLPGSIRSLPASTIAGASLPADQSDITNPSNPHSSRSMSVSSFFAFGCESAINLVVG